MSHLRPLFDSELSNVHDEEVARLIDRSIDLIDVDTSICIAFGLEITSITITTVLQLVNFTSLHIVATPLLHLSLTQ